MARPAHVPEATWARCVGDVGQARTPGAMPNLAAGIEPLGAVRDAGMGPAVLMEGGPAAALLIGGIGSQVSRAIAPDTTTADAWSWNHTMRSCLEDRGIRLP